MKMNQVIKTINVLLKPRLMANAMEQVEVSNQLLETLKNTYGDGIEQPLMACLKSLGIRFSGDENVDLVRHENPEAKDLYGEFFNPDLYQSTLSLSLLALYIENNGDAISHAVKLSVLFSNPKEVLAYLEQYSKQSNINEDSLLHDACLFVLPDFSKPDFLNPQTGCNFAEWKKFANKTNQMFDKEFVTLFPLAFELTQLVRTKIMEEKSKPNRADIKNLNAAKKAYEDKAKPLEALDNEYNQLKKQKIAGKLSEEEMQRFKNTQIKIKEIEREIELLPNRDLIQDIILKRKIKNYGIEFNALEKHKERLDGDQEERYHTLVTKINHAQRALIDALGGKFLKNLTIDEIKAFYQLYKYNKSTAHKIFVDHGIPPRYFAEFEKLCRIDDDKQIPNIKIDGAALGFPGKYLIKCPVEDESYAALAACLGKETNCCQSLSGESGHECVIHGLTSPNGGFYILFHGDVNDPKVTDTIVGQAWAWRSKSGAIVFDSVEKNPTANPHVVHRFFSELAQKLVSSGYTDKVVCGDSSGISKMMGDIFWVNPLEEFIDYSGYCDSKSQRVLIQKNKPYYFFSRDKNSYEETVKLITSLFSSSIPLGESNEFLNLLYFASNYSGQYGKSTNKPNPLLKLIIEKAGSRLNEVENLLSAMNQYREGIITYHDIISLSGKASFWVNMIDYKDRTPLMLAIEQQDIKAVNLILQKGADVNQKTITKRTALNSAVEIRNRKITAVLLAKGANINDQDANGESALFTAVRNKDEEMVQLLIERGANVDLKNNQRSSAINCTHSDSESIATKLLSATKKELTSADLFMAVKKNWGGIIEQLVRTHKLDVNEPDEQGRKPLELCTNIETIKKLLSLGADNASLNAALIQSAKNNNPELTWKLVKLGADINTRDNEGRTPLSIILNQSTFINNLGDKEKQYILKLIGTSDVMNDGNYLMSRAVEIDNNQNEITRALYSRGANVNIPNIMGETALMHCRDPALAEQLLQWGADINSHDKNGKTALMHSKNADVAHIILNWEADVTIQDSEGTTALMYWKKADVATRIMELGCDVNTVTNSNETAITLALKAHRYRNSYDNIVEYLTSLINHGAVVNLNTLLLGLQTKDQDVENILIKYFNLSSSEEQAWQLLYETLYQATSQGMEELALDLFEKGAGINLLNYQRSSLQSLAQERGLDKVVSIIQESRDHEELMTHVVSQADFDKALELINQGILIRSTVEYKLELLNQMLDQSCGEVFNALVGIIDFDYISLEQKQLLLNQAAYYGKNVLAVHLLLHNPSLLDFKDHNGYTPIMYAAENNNFELMRLAAHQPNNLEEKNSKGDTALSLACAQNHYEAVSALLTIGADVNVIDSDNETLLHRSILNNFPEMAQLLLDNNVDCSVANHSGKKPIELLEELGLSSEPEWKKIVAILKMKDLIPISPSVSDRVRFFSSNNEPYNQGNESIPENEQNNINKKSK